VSLLFLLYLAASILFEKYTLKELVLICIIGLFLVLSYRNQPDTTLLRVFLLVIAFKNFDFYKLIKFDMKLKIIGVFTVIFLHFAGIFEDVYLVREDYIRHSLGFIHPNRLATYVCVIILQWLVLRMHERKITAYNYIVAIAIALITDAITGSRTTLIIMMLGIFTSFFFYYIPRLSIKRNVIVRAISVFIVPVLSLVSYYIASGFDVRLEGWRNLDVLLSWRVSQMNNIYNNYGLSMLGQEIHLISARVAREQGLDWIILDNAYMALAIRFGVIILIIFSILSIILQRRLLKGRKYELVMIANCFAVLGFTELQFYMIEFNFSLFAFIYLFQPNKQDLYINL